MANKCKMCGGKLGVFENEKLKFREKEYLVCTECKWAIEGYQRSLKNASFKDVDHYKGEIMKKTSQCEDVILKSEIYHLIGKKNEMEDIISEKKVQNIYCICPICGTISDNQGQHSCLKCGYQYQVKELTKEEKIEISKKKEHQIRKNALYEYVVEVIDDNMGGEFDKSGFEEILMRHAMNGWRLHKTFSNELGKNAILGINASIDRTYLIFERCIKCEE